MSGLTCGFNGWWTLFDVVITNPTYTYLVTHIVLSHGVIVTIVIQVKDNIYYDQYLVDMFFLLTIKVFGCFHE
jgi:hypothetical protein